MKVLPKSFWVAYSLLNVAPIARLLPSGLHLSPVKLLADDVPHEPLLLFNAYSVEARFMKGMRVDVQVFARDELTNQAHLVILDVISTTWDWNPIDGIRPPNANGKAALDTFHITTGDQHIDIRAKPTETREIDFAFAVEANRACYFRGFEKPFAMAFNETLVCQPVESMNADVTNTLWSDCRELTPTHVFAHTLPMEFDVNVGHALW